MSPERKRVWVSNGGSDIVNGKVVLSVRVFCDPPYRDPHLSVGVGDPRGMLEPVRKLREAGYEVIIGKTFDERDAPLDEESSRYFSRL